MALTAQQVQQFYIGYYARPADPVGLAYWQTQDEAAALKGFSESAEFTSQFTGLSASQQVTKVYGNLLGRAPDAPGLLYWAGELTAGRETIGSLVLSMIKNALGKDVTTIEDRVTYSTAFTTALNTAEEINAYNGATATQAARDALLKVISNSVGDHTALTAETAKIDTTIAAIVSGGSSNPGQTFTLTTGIDNIVGTAGNDTINAVLDIGTTPSSTTLQIADVIDGGAGTDTMNVTLATATSTIPAATIKNVEVFNIRNVASTVVGGENFANITGETKIVSAGSQAALVLTGVGSGTTLGVSDTAQNLTATYDANAFAAGSTLNLELSKAGTNVSGTITRSTIDVGQATAAGSATGVSIAATGANYVTLAASGGTDIAAAAGIKTLTVTGAGTVDILNTSTLESSSTLAADLTKVDASANTGGVTIQVANKDVAVTGGAGADVVTLANAAALGAASINLGAGDDKLLNSVSAGLGTTSVIDGGAGTDTIVSTLLQVGNQANIKNWEVLDVVGENRTIDASLFSASTFSSIAASGALVGATAVQKLAGTTLNVNVTGATTTGAALTATLADATGTADVANINFAGTGNKVVTSFGSTGIETYNIASGGTLATQTNAVTTLTDTLNTTAKVVITGANALTVGAITTNTAATTATAHVASALKEIDASAATGNVTLGSGTALGTSAAIGTSGFNTTYDGLKVTTGSGDDTITIASKNAVVVAGAGDDTVTVSGTGASVDTGAAKTATGDTVNFNNENQSATFGAGKQTAVIGAAADVGTALTSVTSITGAATGDVINLAAALATAASVDAITDVTASIGTAASLAAALNVAVGLGGGTAAGDLVYFRWVDGNTYIVADKDGTSGSVLVDAADAVVKLVGSYNSMTATDGIVTLG